MISRGDLTFALQFCDATVEMSKGGTDDASPPAAGREGVLVLRRHVGGGGTPT